jgi:unsaturated rhamnogalacturonyl hydrolase
VKRLSLILSILLIISSCSDRSGKYDLTRWPSGSSPDEIGLRLSGRYLNTPNTQYGDIESDVKPTQITYPDVCTWLGALRFAEATNSDTLFTRLKNRFDLLFGPDSILLPAANHVDNCVFGAVPLEIYMKTKDKKYLDLGLLYADRQWQLPDSATAEQKAWAGRGYTWQTRIWIDDMFMITAVQTQAYRATCNPVYIDRAAREMRLYLDTIQLDNGLFYHSTTSHFCWGRGNGWMAAGMAEILKAMPANHPDRPAIMNGYMKMMATLLKYQADDGMWRQVIDDPEFWKESSSTAMFTYAFITGVKNGWLDKKTYGTAARKAWLTLVTYIRKDDNVTAVCEGTGARNDRDYYMTRKRNTGDLHGQAPLLWCATALAQE